MRPQLSSAGLENVRPARAPPDQCSAGASATCVCRALGPTAGRACPPQVERLLEELRRPLGFSPIARRSTRIKLLLALNVPVFDGLVAYADMYQKLSSLAMGLDSEGDLLQVLPMSERVKFLVRWKLRMRTQLEQRVKKYNLVVRCNSEYGAARALQAQFGSVFRRTPPQRQATNMKVTFREEYAAMAIQDAWRIRGHSGALQAVRKRHNGDHPDVALILHGLGCALHASHDSKGAVAPHSESLAMFERLHNRLDHVYTAASMHGLACALKLSGGAEAVQDATQLDRKALEMHRRLDRTADHHEVEEWTRQLARRARDTVVRELQLRRNGLVGLRKPSVVSLMPEHVTIVPKPRLEPRSLEVEILAWPRQAIKPETRALLIAAEEACRLALDEVVEDATKQIIHRMPHAGVRIGLGSELAGRPLANGSHSPRCLNLPNNDPDLWQSGPPASRGDCEGHQQGQLLGGSSAKQPAEPVRTHEMNPSSGWRAGTGSLSSRAADRIGDAELHKVASEPRRLGEPQWWTPGNAPEPIDPDEQHDLWI